MIYKSRLIILFLLCCVLSIQFFLRFEPNEDELFVVTPTYFRRRVQRVFSLSAMFVSMCASGRRIRWIIVDSDANRPLPRFATCSRVRSRRVSHDSFQTDDKHRGAHQRNVAIEYIVENAKDDDAVVFADDDNLFAVEFWRRASFKNTKKNVLLWPVGFPGNENVYEMPLLDEGGRLRDFRRVWCEKNRRFPVDMAGFAVRVEALKRGARFNSSANPGYLESTFIEDALLGKNENALVRDNINIAAWHMEWNSNEAKDVYLKASSAAADAC